jgi:nucleoside-diphosphate-sugar epimerase
MVGVTGASGFIGRHLVQALVARGVDVRCLLRARTAPPATRGRASSPAGAPPDAAPASSAPAPGRGTVHVTTGDLLGDDDALRAFVAGVDVLVHAAGVTETSDLGGYYRGNADATARLMTAAAHARVGRVVYLSTIDVTLALATPYARSKARAEDAVRAAGVPAAIIRPSVVYGPGDTKNLAAVLGTMRRTRIAPIPGTGDFSRQPIFVDDVVALIVEHVVGPPWTGVRTLTALGPDVLTFRELVARLAEAARLHVLPVRIPLAVLRTIGALAHAVVGENAFARVASAAGDRTAAALPRQSPVWIGSTPFREGLRRMLGSAAAPA